jgi:hypothetical protein
MNRQRRVISRLPGLPQSLSRSERPQNDRNIGEQRFFEPALKKKTDARLPHRIGFYKGQGEQRGVAVY